MPTKIQGKKSSTQQKPSQPSVRKTTTQKRDYIDHPDDLALIEEILDAAIEEAQGNVEDLESFFEFAEEYSEDFECSDGGIYPLKFNYYEKDSEITGFNVAFADDPKVTTSGTKIMENQGYDKDDPERSKFTISSLLERLEIEEEPEKESRVRKATPKSTVNPRAFSKTATKRQTEDTDEEEEDLDDLLSTEQEESTDEETPITKGALGKVAKSRKQQLSPNTGGNRNNNGQTNLTEQVSRIAAGAATQGSTVDGVNLAGGVGQFATLATVVGIKTAETIWNTIEEAREAGREKRVQEIENYIQNLCVRADDLTNSVDSIQKTNAAKPPSKLDSLAVKKSNQEKIEEQHSSDAAKDTPLAQATASIDGKINELASKLDPEYKSKPLELDKEKSIDERLDQIEKYLDKLSARLDRLEAVVGELDRKLDSQKRVEASDDIDEFVVNRKNEQQRPIVAEALVKYAMATGEDASTGLPVADGTLYVTRVDNKVTVSLEASNGIEIFQGSKTNEEWTIPALADKLNLSEKDQILKLPQSEEEYDRLSTAQDLVEKFQQTFPKRFSGEKDPTFPWKEEGIVKYEFEILDLPNGSQELIGCDPRQGDKQVFDAVLTEGERAEVRKCSIPLEDMEKALYEEKTRDRSGVNSGSKAQKDDQIEM